MDKDKDDTEPLARSSSHELRGITSSPLLSLASTDHNLPSNVNGRNSPAPALLQTDRHSAAEQRRTPSRQFIASVSYNALHPIAGVSCSLPDLENPVAVTQEEVSQEGQSTENMSSRAPWTASSVAKEYLQKEVDAHLKLESEVAVIFHDACYGHRYSRPRTSRANLSTIVERPERILAIALGVATAYVLLGEHYAGGVHAPHPMALPGLLPPFLIRKSSRYVDITSTAVTNVHGTKWMAELKNMCEAAESKLMHNGKELVRPRDPDNSSQQNKPKLHEGDLYLCAESLSAFEGALGGVLDAVDTVFATEGPSRAFVCVRPPGHHCSDDYPSGFCWLNNVHVGISHAALEHGLTHAAIFDFDLHHGDGSQSIAWAHNTRATSLPKNAPPSKKTSIGYYSLHDINSYPCEYGEEDKVRNASLCIENAHGQNVWNIHLQPWKTEAEFWKLYEERYSVLIEKMRTFLMSQYQKLRSTSLNVPPKGAIFISAGFDASEWEGQGMQRHKVNVPTSFYARITRDIVKLSQEGGLGVDGRVISVLEGGYSNRALASGVLSHMCGLSSISSAEEVSETTVTSGPLPIKYDDSWWSASRLEELERSGNSEPSQVSKKTKSDIASSYHTPTQSFVAKVVSAPTYQRSVANSISQHSIASKARARSPTPPPPEVDWVTASYELSQIIIPQNRQTRSCQAEDLNAKATEARKVRQSILNSTSLPTDEALETRLEKVSLKDRRTKTSKVPKEETRSDSSTATSRRKTFGGMEALQKETAKRSNRRLSIASATLSSVDDSFVKSSTPPIETPPVTKTRAPSKARAPRKTVTKPPVPKASTAKKAVVSPTSDFIDDNTNISGDGAMDDLVSGMKNIRIKLNVPSKAENDRKEVAKSASKDLKKPVRAPRKSAMKKTTSTDSVSSNGPEPPIQPFIVVAAKNQPQSPSATILPSNSRILPPPSFSTTEYHPEPPIDGLLFNQAPLDPTLAEYLAFSPNRETAPWNVPLPSSPNPSNGYTPVAPRFNDLPTFSSHSPIPFANATTANNSGLGDGKIGNTEYDNGFGVDHFANSKEWSDSVFIKEEDKM